MTLQECREAINQLDSQILPLFLRRMEIAEEVARLKIKGNLPLYHPDREQAIRDRLAKNAPQAMVPYVNALYDTIFSLSRKRQTELGLKQTQPYSHTSKPEL